MCAKMCSAVLGSKRLEGSSLSITGAWTNMNKLCIHTVDQGSFDLGTITSGRSFVVGRCPEHCRMLSSILGAYPLDDIAVVTTKTRKTSPDIVKCPWGTLRPTSYVLMWSSPGYSKKRKVQNSTYIVCCHLC